MTTENIGSLYPTKIPGYDDAADIQAALRAYHYGSTTYDITNTDPSQIPASSVAGYLKAISEDVTALEETGVGSVYAPTAPTGVPNGYIWVDSDSVPSTTFGKNWVLTHSGSLSGSSVILIENLSCEKFFIVLQDWSHNDATSTVDLKITFNGDSGPNYVNTGGLVSASGLYSAEFANTDTQDITIAVDLANTASLLKPVSTIASTVAGQYFGYYKNTNPITSARIVVNAEASFDGGNYQVWSYK
jgi:hypothetical protein